MCESYELSWNALFSILNINANVLGIFFCRCQRHLTLFSSSAGIKACCTVSMWWSNTLSAVSHTRGNVDWRTRHDFLRRHTFPFEAALLSSLWPATPLGVVVNPGLPGLPVPFSNPPASSPISPAAVRGRSLRCWAAGSNCKLWWQVSVVWTPAALMTVPLAYSRTSSDFHTHTHTFRC